MPEMTLEALEAELREPVRAAAMPPRPAWAADLDRRVEAGFPKARRPRKQRGAWIVWGPVAAVACGLIALVIALPGGSGRDTGSSSGDTAQSLAAPRSTSGGESAGSAAPSAPAPFAGRKVERTTELTVGVAPAKLQAAAQRVYALVGQAGGIVDSSSVSSGGGTGSASFALRIPADRLDRTVTRLAALGRVRSQTGGTQDITASFASVAERLRGAEAERRGILRALGRATTQAQLDALRERRRIVDAQIAGLRRERASLRKRTSYGRVTLDLVASRSGAVPVPSDGRWTPGDALGDAGRILSVAAGVAILVLALALPVAALAGLGWAAGRPLRRRRRESALGPA